MTVTRDPETATDDMWENLREVRAAHGPRACPCHFAMTCPLHFCGCWNYRMPWECDCPT